MEKVENVSLKMEERFVKLLEKVMKKHNYMTKTEFIREAIREKIATLEREEMLRAIDRIHGSSRRTTSDEDLHKARDRAFSLLEKKRSK